LTDLLTLISLQVLHFSVQRFVFDLKTLGRKKSKNLIKYPPTIDMARWKTTNQPTSTPSTSASEDVYDLCGVLIHKGSSAYSGHYESQVLDVRSVSSVFLYSRLIRIQ
jgi:ubiquitin carboxyl-terminal hydrolase 48